MPSLELAARPTQAAAHAVRRRARVHGWASDAGAGRLDARLQGRGITHEREAAASHASAGPGRRTRGATATSHASTGPWHHTRAQARAWHARRDCDVTREHRTAASHHPSARPEPHTRAQARASDAGRDCDVTREHRTAASHHPSARPGPHTRLQGRGVTRDCGAGHQARDRAGVLSAGQPSVWRPTCQWGAGARVWSSLRAGPELTGAEAGSAGGVRLLAGRVVSWGGSRAARTG